MVRELRKILVLILRKKFDSGETDDVQQYLHLPSGTANFAWMLFWSGGVVSTSSAFLLPLDAVGVMGSESSCDREPEAIGRDVDVTCGELLRSDDLSGAFPLVDTLCCPLATFGTSCILSYSCAPVATWLPPKSEKLEIGSTPK
jgi:hypothetical protein